MDNVLRFAADGSGGQRTIEVEKSTEPPPLSGFPRLRLDLHEGTLTATAMPQREYLHVGVYESFIFELVPAPRRRHAHAPALAGR